MSKGRRKDVLPLSLAPRGLSRLEAAVYIGVSPTLFDEMVKDGRMPKPIRINARAVWDRLKLDEAFAALSDTQASAGWPAAPEHPARRHGQIACGPGFTSTVSGRWTLSPTPTLACSAS